MKHEGQNSGIVVWGIHPIEEMVSVAPEHIRQINVLPSFGRKKAQHNLLDRIKSKGLPLITPKDFHRFSLPVNAVHQGICALVDEFWKVDLHELIQRSKAEGAQLVVCDQISDPQNLGAIIRASVAFGASGLVIPQKNNARINGTVIKASSGAVFHIRVCTHVSIRKGLEQLKEEGISIAGLDARGDIDVSSLSSIQPFCALILGSESKGIRKSLKNQVDMLVRIPIYPRLDSLNVSCAACIALYELSKNRPQTNDRAFE